MKTHRFPLLLLAVVWAIFSAVVISTWGWTYWDFGDGNYLYVGRRLNEGLVPYRDILAPQPPLHLILGASAQRIGGWFGSDLFGARAYCLLLRLAASLLVYLLGFEVFRCTRRALLAAAVYLVLPIGFWWSLCVQSENVEIVFLLAAFLGLLKLNSRWAAAAGAASALAMHCNMTAVPYFLVNALFLACRRPRLLGWYAGAALGVWGFGAAAAWAWCGPDYFSNVVLNQTGSFPKEELLGYPPIIYFRDKVLNEGMKVLEIEGGWILAAIVALALGTRDAMGRAGAGRDDRLRWEYAAWSAVGFMLSIGFVMKGGTVNYIFVLGEPVVALFGADAVFRLIHAAWPSLADLKATRFSNTLPFLRAAFVAASIVFVASPLGIRHLGWTLDELQSELPERGVLRLVSLIEAYSEPGDPILAPPYYAWATDRRVAGELAENYLWQIKFYNESVLEGIEGEAVLKMREIAAMLRRREVPIVLLDLGQTGRVPFIAEAIEAYYQPLADEPFTTRNTRLGLYVPIGVEVLDPSPLTEPSGS